jgi:hypothetical protein
MKAAIIVLVSLTLIFFILQGFISKSTNDVEQYSYEVLKEYKDFEVRQYEAALFSSVDLNTGKHKDKSSGGFRILAGYIFGGNDSGESIAMTSPVAMNIGKKNAKMSFMVPSNYKEEALPKPDNKNIYFETKKACVMAAIRFGGWANDQKIDQHVKALKKYLKKAGLQHKENFSYFGYNPPYEMMNRRNEVVVELINYSE